MFKTTPTGFLPAKDQRAIFGEIVLPEGSSVNVTAEVSKQVEERIRGTPGVAGVMTVVGYSKLDGQVKSNAALMALTLEPFADHTAPELSANALIRQLTVNGQHVRRANVIFNNLLPPSGLEPVRASSSSFRASGVPRRRKWRL